MSDQPEAKIIDMKAQAKLIQEARDARAKRKAERGLFASLTPEQQKQALAYCGEETIGPQFPGGIDDMELS